jgi:SAM-dependent methyltransferase
MTERPRPPDDLLLRVLSKMGGGADEEDYLVFDRSGCQSAQELEIFVASVGRTLDSFTRVLDFGCGPGRVTRWLEPLTATWELHGCDIDKQAIDWDQKHLPFATFEHTGAEPPLPYSDGYFDLVINHSVFTHIDERYQDLWLEELRRVVAPGGLLILSIHGEFAFQIAEGEMRGGGEDPEPWRRALERHGILFVADDAYLGGVFPDFYHTTFHSPWYVFSHWSKWFDVKSYLPTADLGRQDVVVLQRRTDDQEALLPLQPAIDQQSGSPLKLLARRGAERLLQRLVPEDQVDQAPQRIPHVVHVILEEHGRRLRALEDRAK